MRDVIALVLLAGCAVSAPTRETMHPTNASAPTGRLAGAPPALRPGVVEYKDVPPVRGDAPQPSHHHHHGQ